MLPLFYERGEAVISESFNPRPPCSKRASVLLLRVPQTEDWSSLLPL